MKGLRIKAFILAPLLWMSLAQASPVPEAVPGEYVVKLKPQVQKMSLKSLGDELGSYVKSQIPGQNIVVIKRPVFELQENVIKFIGQNSSVELVEPNYIYRINKSANDPLFDKLWGMKNTGAADSSGQTGVEGVDINVEKAWDIQTGSDSVVVAVIDTGVDYNNADLKENIWTNEAELNGKPGVDDDKNGFVDDIHGYNFVKKNGDPMDDHGHGTHCSGTIGARGNDGKGIVGVAWNVKIMGIKFLSAEGSGTLEDALKAIDYATLMGAKVMSNSWGGGGFSQTLKEAIERSHKAGALFVAAAGNETNNNDSYPTYPATYDVPNVLAVAAVDNRGRLASFSNYGRKSVHVGAPGVRIFSSTTSGYESWSGTSMATPHVSGVAALLAANEPNLSNVEMKNRIITTSRTIAGLRNKVINNGMIDAYNVLTNTLPQPDGNDPRNWATVAQSISSPHPYNKNEKKSWTVTVPGAKQVAIFFSKIDTEADYDLVKIKDASGNVIDTYSGADSDVFSVPVDGDTLTIEFSSDYDVNGYGFDITKAAYR